MKRLLNLIVLLCLATFAQAAGTNVYEQVSASGQATKSDGALIRPSIQGTEYTLSSGKRLSGQCIVSGKLSTGETFVVNSSPSEIVVATDGKSAFVRVNFNMAGVLHKLMMKFEKRQDGDYIKWCLVSRNLPAPTSNDFVKLTGTFSCQYRTF